MSNMYMAETVNEGGNTRRKFLSTSADFLILLPANKILGLLNLDSRPQSNNRVNMKSYKRLIKLYRSLNRKEVAMSEDIRQVQQRLKGLDGIQFIVEKISTDSFLKDTFIRYLRKLGYSSKVSIERSMVSGFLLNNGIAVDDQFTTTGLIYKKYTAIPLSKIIEEIPELQGLLDDSVQESEVIAIHYCSGESRLNGFSTGGKSIVIYEGGGVPEEDVFLNEITSQVFGRYTRNIDFEGLTIGKADPLLLQNYTEIFSVEHNINEYWGDLVNLAINPSSHIMHMLWIGGKYKAIELAFGSKKAQEYMNQELPTYIVSKHKVIGFLTSRELLSKSNDKNEDVYNAYIHKLGAEVSKLKNGSRSLGGINELHLWLSDIIKSDDALLYEAQSYAIKELDVLNIYLNSLKE